MLTAAWLILLSAMKTTMACRCCACWSSEPCTTCRAQGQGSKACWSSEPCTTCRAQGQGSKACWSSIGWLIKPRINHSHPGVCVPAHDPAYPAPAPPPRLYGSGGRGPGPAPRTACPPGPLHRTAGRGSACKVGSGVGHIGVRCGAHLGCMCGPHGGLMGVWCGPEGMQPGSAPFPPPLTWPQWPCTASCPCAP